MAGKELRFCLIEDRMQNDGGNAILGVMTKVTQIIELLQQGDPRAAAELLPLVYEELRKLAAARLAAENPGQTLQATALVHEAYLRLVGGDADRNWDGRGHFFAAAAESMRRILINRARDKNRLKRGGGKKRMELDEIAVALDTPDEELLALDEALQALAEDDPVAAQLVELKFFAGLSLRQAAETLAVPRRTADRHWAYARAWLFERLGGEDRCNSSTP
jgi:RNA polymerase sigma factor (TIGR02999 family)